MNIRLNLSDAFFNKTNIDDNKRNFGFSFHPKEVGLPELVKHIREGKAFTVGCFKDNHRIESNFVSSQLLALDLDQCPMDIDQLEDWSEFIQQHAFMMYATPTSTKEQPKTRILFLLDEPIEHPTRWRALQLGLMEEFAQVKPDGACKDPSRLFFGSFTKHYLVDYQNRLPLALAGSLARFQADRDEFQRIALQYTTITPRGNTDLERAANNFLNHGLRRVASAPEGQKHNMFRNYALWLYGLNAGGWPISKGEIENGLSSIARAWGDNEATIKNNLGWPERNCTPIDTKDVQISGRGQHVQNLKRQEYYQQRSVK